MLLTTSNNSLFDTFFNDPWFDTDPWFNDRDIRKAEKKLYGHNGKNLMLTDIKENENGYELMMDLPGYKKEEVTAKLENGYLTITAEKGLEEEDKDDKKKYLRRERFAGTCQRTFYVGEEVEQEDIKASFKHGILSIQVPKKEAKPKVEEHKCITIEG